MSSLGPKRYDAFLSYNSQDRPAVHEVAERLKGEGLVLYLEQWELAPGREFQPALAEGLRDSKTCVVFLGPNGLGPWQKQEVQVAIDRRASDEAFHVIPVLLPGAERPRGGDVAHLDFLINASWIEFLTTLDDERAFRNLVWGITGTKPPELGATRCEGVCPYRGLEAFRPDDAKFFFGRENLTGWLVSALRREVRAAQGVRFLGVLGPSGSGKSSVVLAGLVPRLMAGAIEESEHWPVAILRPGDDPLKSLTEKVVPLLRKEVCPDPSLSESREQKELLADLRTDGEEAATELDRYIGLKFADDLEDRRLIIVVDQFEEVFTYRPQDDQARKRFEQARASFFANLLNAAATPGGRVVVVLTMRSDFLGDCTAFPQLAAVLSDHQKLIGPMTPEELHRAIEQPAYLVGCELKEGLSDLLIDDVKGQAGALPLLQFTLKELWTMRDVRWLTHAAYRAMGGVRGAIERGADEIYRSFNPEEQRICRRIFLHLVQLGEGTGDTTKRRVSYRELLPQDPKQAEAVRKVLLRLADPKARLITTTGADVPEGYDLRLMSSMNDASGIPTGGKGLIIVASVDNVLHIRIFGGDGKVVVDTDEKWLTEQARQIEDLRKRLESLWPPHELTKSEKSRVITAVTSIVGHTLPEAEGSVEVAHEALIRHWSELHKWIDAEIEFLRSWARLRSNARHWEEKGQRRDLLLSEGHLLAEAEDLLLCHESELDPDDIAIAYARASITKNNRHGLYNWISLCLFVSVPSLLWAGHDLASVDSARAAYNKTFSLDVTNLDIIWGWILSIPPLVIPLWVTYRKWRGRPEFETVHLDTSFWAINLILYLVVITILITLLVLKPITGVIKFTMVGLVPGYTILAMVAAALLWKNARVGRYYRQCRNNLCKFEIVRTSSSRLISKAGLAFASFVLVMSEIVGLFVLPSVTGRQHALELYQAHREIADYQIRDGQFERALDSLNRALRANFPRRDGNA